jgi:hypothetical protein
MFFHNASYLSELNDIVDRFVVVGGGEKHHVQGFGKVVVDGLERSVLLADVLYVPTMCMNLLSVCQMTAAGAQVIVSRNECAVEYKGRKVLIAKKQHKLFTVNIPVTTERWGLGVMSMDVWHRRLGHLGYDGLQRMVQEDMVEGVSTSGYT